MCNFIHTNIIKDVFDCREYKTSFSWDNYDDKDLEKAAKSIIDRGILAFFKEIGVENNVTSPKCFLIDPNSMMMLNMLINNEESNINNEDIFVNCNKSCEAIDVIHKKFTEKKLDFDFIKTYAKMQGLAFKKNVFINKTFAYPELGLHVLTHEIMHTLANENAVKVLREGMNNDNRDEGINEFFARVISLFLMKENQQYGLSANDEKIPFQGVYASNIKEDKYLCSIKDEIDKNMKEKIMMLGKFYFMGEDNDVCKFYKTNK